MKTSFSLHVILFNIVLFLNFYARILCVPKLNQVTCMHVQSLHPFKTWHTHSRPLKQACYFYISFEYQRAKSAANAGGDDRALCGLHAFISDRAYARQHAHGRASLAAIAHHQDVHLPQAQEVFSSEYMSLFF